MEEFLLDALCTKIALELHQNISPQAAHARSGELPNFGKLHERARPKPQNLYDRCCACEAPLLNTGSKCRFIKPNADGEQCWEMS